MNNNIQPYNIKEIFPGHFHMILDFLEIKDVLEIISPDYKYIWFYDIKACSVKWNKVDCTLFDKHVDDIMVRNASFECLVDTERIDEILPNLEYGVSLVQLNKIPPHYVRMENKTMSAKTKYDLLREIDYLFELYIPKASDYGWIICSDFCYLQKLKMHFTSVIR